MTAKEKPNKKSLAAVLRILLFVFVVVATAGLIAFFAIHKSPPIEVASPDAPEHSETKPPIPDLAKPATLVAPTARANENRVGNDPALSDVAKSVILRCTQGVDDLRGLTRADEFQDLDGYLKKAASGPETDRKLEIENLHVRRPNGQVWRLQVAPALDPRGTGDRLGLKLFLTDAQDLPIPTPLPQDLADQDPMQALAKLRHDNEVIFDEATESLRFGDVGARLTKHNGVTDHVELYFSQSALACARPEENLNRPIECQCL